MSEESIRMLIQRIDELKNELKIQYSKIIIVRDHLVKRRIHWEQLGPYSQRSYVCPELELNIEFIDLVVKGK